MNNLLSIGYKTEKDSGIDTTGNPQHGFKQNRSMATAVLKILLILAHALDYNTHRLMASIEFSAAFDMVTVPLLINRLKILKLSNEFQGYLYCMVSFYLNMTTLRHRFEIKLISTRYLLGILAAGQFFNMNI